MFKQVVLCVARTLVPCGKVDDCILCGQGVVANHTPIRLKVHRKHSGAPANTFTFCAWTCHIKLLSMPNITARTRWARRERVLVVTGWAPKSKRWLHQTFVHLVCAVSFGPSPPGVCACWLVSCGVALLIVLVGLFCAGGLPCVSWCVSLLVVRFGALWPASASFCGAWFALVLVGLF